AGLLPDLKPAPPLFQDRGRKMGSLAGRVEVVGQGCGGGHARSPPKKGSFARAVPVQGPPSPFFPPFPRSFFLRFFLKSNQSAAYEKSGKGDRGKTGTPGSFCGIFAVTYYSPECYGQ